MIVAIWLSDARKNLKAQFILFCNQHQSILHYCAIENSAALKACARA
jgi:hypothetical protein